MAYVIGAKPANESSESYSDSDKTVNRVYELTFYVKTSGNEREQAALAAVGVPAIGAYWASGSESDSGARCISRSAEEVSPHFWHVTCEFDTKASPESENPDTAPEDRTPEWSWSYETKEVALIKDAIAVPDKAILNAAKEPLFATTQKPIAVLTISRYQTSFDEQTIFDYVGKKNSAVFWGSAIHTAMMAGINDSPVEIDGRKLRRVEYVIKFDQDGWEIELLNHGTRYDNDPPNEDWRAFEDKPGNATTGNLKLDGGKLAPGGNPTFLTFDAQPEANLNDLDLGPTWA